MSAEVGFNKYEEVKTVPVVDLVFTSSKKSLIDRVSDAPLQFTRNTIGTYVDENGIIQTAAAGEPRYTYDPETGEELGLLVEEERTNLLKYSEEFSNNEWIKTNVTPDVTIIAPDGISLAEKIKENSTISATHAVNINTATLMNGVYAFSVYVKSSGRSIIALNFTYANGVFSTFDSRAWFNLSNGTVGTTVNVSSATIDPVGSSGWYRCTLVSQSFSGANRKVLIATSIADGSVTHNGDGTSGIYVWGAQLEAGSYATSYIPTDGTLGGISRDPDLVTLTNNNIYDNEKFDIINQPFGVSAGSNTLTLLPTDKPVKRVTIFSPNTTQERINTFADKEDEFWRWRVTGDSFGLNQFGTDGQVTVDWDDGTIETLTTSDHTFTDGKTYHEIGFRLDSGTHMSILINGNAIHKDKVVAIGPAPESMVVNPFVGFKNCSNLVSFDPSLRLIELNSAQSATHAWLGCGKLKSFPLIDTSNITNFSNAWQGCTSLTSFPEINTSNVTNFAGAWNGCTGLTSFPEIDTSNGTTFNTSWIGCTSLTSFPEINTSKGIDFGVAWYNCNSLTDFPEINTSLGQSFYATWYNCSSLTSFPEINTSNGTNFSTSWRNCSNLIDFPSLNISKGQNFYTAWFFCTSLTNFPANFFDTWSGTPVADCFRDTWTGCSSLTSTSVENVYNSISISPSSSTPPASGTNIDVDYNVASGTPDITVSAIDLTAKGWTPTLNGTAQTDPYSFASLDLDFATNKTLNDNVSSSNLITFTRNSIGTYVDSNGVIQTAVADEPRFDHDPVTNESLGLLVEEGRTNDIAYSEEQLGSFFLERSQIVNYDNVAPDGTFTAIRFIEEDSIGDHRIRKYASTTQGQVVTISAFVKSNGRDYVWLVGDMTNGTWFNLATGTVASGPGSITPYGNGWWRISTTGTQLSTNSNNSFAMWVQTSTGVFQNSTGDGTSGIYLWGLQLEAGSFPTSYIPTPATFTSRNSTATYYDSNGVIQTAAIDVARDDAYLPDENGNFISAGLLLEESKTNFITRSEELDDTGSTTGWFAQSSSVFPNVILSPDGNTTADKLVESNLTSEHYIRTRSTASVVSGNKYTISIFAKPAERSILRIAATSSTLPGSVTFDLLNQTFSENGAIGHPVQVLPNGWYRCSATFTASASSTTFSYFYLSGFYAGDGTSGMYLWGAQFETGSYATSYIPTAGSTVTRAADISTSSTVTRSADVVSVTGTNFSSWYNQDQGTFTLKTSALKSGAGGSILLGGISGAGYGEIEIFNNITEVWFIDYLNSPFRKISHDVSVGENRISASYDNQTAEVIAVNGTVSTTSQNFNTLTNVITGISLMRRHTQSFESNGTISRLTYWPKRLTDTSLQYLTQ